MKSSPAVSKAAYQRQQAAMKARRLQVIGELREKAAADPGFIWEEMAQEAVDRYFADYGERV